MSSFKKLTQIDEHTKFAVYGWIREAEQELHVQSSQHIPSMIHSVCLLYFYQEEMFEIIAAGAETKDEGKVISTIGQYSFYVNICRNYGKMIISSQSDRYYRWNLKVLRLPAEHGAKIFIGISSSVETKGIYSWALGFGAGNHYYYAIHDNGSKYMQSIKGWMPYLKGCKRIMAGDEIRIDLDLKRAEIKYFINGQDQGVAYKNVMKGWQIDYRLMIGMDEGEIIKMQILSFFDFA